LNSFVAFCVRTPQSLSIKITTNRCEYANASCSQYSAIATYKELSLAFLTQNIYRGNDRSYQTLTSFLIAITNLMASSEASLPRANLSSYALKYGETDISGFENSGKSLYTPLSAEKGEYNQINRDKRRIDLYQRNLFQGFSIRDILDAGGISQSRVRESNLDNALHPL